MQWCSRCMSPAVDGPPSTQPLARCADSDAVATRELPAEVPHPALPGEDRCAFHLEQLALWAERERKAAERLRDEGRGRRPTPYVPRSRPPRFVGAELTRDEVGDIKDAMAKVLVARSSLDVALDNGAPRIASSDVRPLLRAVAELALVMDPVLGRGSDGPSS